MLLINCKMNVNIAHQPKQIHKVSPVTVKHHPVVKRQVCQQKREHSQLLQKQFDEKQSRSQHAALKTVSQSKGQLTRTKRKLNLTTAELKRQCTVNIKVALHK